MCKIDKSSYDEKSLFPPILAVDFDGTIVDDQFPLLGEPSWTVVNTIKEYQKTGWKIILWTCRTDDMLKEAVDFCKKELGLHFDAVNQNLPEVQAYYGGDTRKVFANLYLDDRNACVKQDVPFGSHYISRNPLFSYPFDVCEAYGI